jgi:phosphoribosylaminoimidazole-succinocarboxamide synthase
MNFQTSIFREGKAKRIIWDGSSEVCSMEFKDSLTAFNGTKQETLKGKGILNASISAKILSFLNGQKIKTHYLRTLAPNMLEVKNLKMLPVEVIVRNYSAGSFSKRLQVEEGKLLKKPLIQFHLKDDSLGDPLLSENEIYELELATVEQIRKIKNLALMINWILVALFKQVDICVADFKLEFGVDSEGELYLADEMSPDNMRLWRNFNGKPESIQKLDKDRFREGLGNVLENYQYVLDKLTEVLTNPKSASKTPVKVNLFIYPQPGLLDPTGRTLTHTTNQLGFKEVENVKAGKYIQIDLSDFRVNLVEELCERILVSPAAESFEYEILP